MTQTSGLWTTSGSPSGDQVASYTQALAARMHSIIAACSGKDGVAPGYGNELACSDGGTETVDVATGGAVVDGIWFDSDAVENVNIPATSADYRIDRIVVEVTWASFECEITVISGSQSSSPTAPSIPNTPGTNYAIQLCQVLVDSGGNVTVTDERTWAIVDTDDSTLEHSAGTLQIKDSGVTAAKIANRTRKFLAQATDAYHVTSAQAIARTTQVGYKMDDAAVCHGFAAFIVPQDFASGLTVAPVFYPTLGSGNIYYKSDATYGAAGEAYNVHSTLGSYAAVAGASDDWMVGTALSLSSAAANDYVTMRFYRDATHASDTYGDFVYFLGFLVSYTADS